MIASLQVYETAVPKYISMQEHIEQQAMRSMAAANAEQDQLHDRKARKAAYMRMSRSLARNLSMI